MTLTEVPKSPKEDPASIQERFDSAINTAAEDLIENRKLPYALDQIKEFLAGDDEAIQKVGMHPLAPYWPDSDLIQDPAIESFDPENYTKLLFEVVKYEDINHDKKSQEIFMRQQVAEKRYTYLNLMGSKGGEKARKMFVDDFMGQLIPEIAKLIELGHGEELKRLLATLDYKEKFAIGEARKEAKENLIEENVMWENLQRTEMETAKVMKKTEAGNPSIEDRIEEKKFQELLDIGEKASPNELLNYLIKHPDIKKEIRWIFQFPLKAV
jgi:hypothetical protein